MQHIRLYPSANDLIVSVRKFLYELWAVRSGRTVGIMKSKRWKGTLEHKFNVFRRYAHHNSERAQRSAPGNSLLDDILQSL